MLAYLDTATLMVLGAAVNALMAAAMLWAWRIGAEREGLGYWTLAWSLTALGFILFAFRPGPPLVAIILPNAASLSGMACFLVGSEVIMGRAPSGSFARGVAVGATLVLVLFTGPLPSTAARVLVYSFAVSILALASAKAFRKPRSPRLLPIGHAAMGCFLGVALLGFARIAAVAADFRNGADYPLGASPSEKIILLAGFLLYSSLGLTQLQLVFSLFRMDLEAAAAEKELLYREMNHRIKNNLALVESLIALQEGELGGGPGSEALSELRARVHAVTALHERLYAGSSVRDVRADHYLEPLAGASTRMAPGVSIETAISPILFDVDRAIPVGIIANELVTNALKHAFPGGRGGRVRVELGCSGGDIHLLIEDDGVGVTGDRSAREGSGGFGMVLVDSLVRQLGGRLDIEARETEGTSARVVFPVKAATCA